MKRRGISTRNLLWQYFLSYLIVMLTVMIILLVYAYNSFYRFHTQILMERNMNGLELVRETNENELSQLMAMTAQFTSSPNMTPFSFRKEPEKAIRLIDQLSVYTASNNFLKGLYIKFYDDEFIYSSTSSYKVGDFVDKAAVFSSMTREELLFTLEHTRQLTIMPVQDINGYLFTSQFKTKSMLPVFVPVVYSSGVGCGTALYLVEKHTYTDMFRRITGDGQDVYILQGDKVLVSREENGVPREMVLAAAAGVSEGEVAHLKYGQEGYSLLQIPGNTMGYRYMLLVSDRELSVAMADTLKVLVVVVAVVSALGLLLITRFVQSRIKPIRLLHSMLLDKASTGNELIEIRDGVQKLIDDNMLLNTRMESTEVLRKAEFALRFLKGSFASTDEWFAMAEDICLNVDFPAFAVCILAKPENAEYELAPDKLNHLFSGNVSSVSRMLDVRDKAVLVVFGNGEGALQACLESKFEGMKTLCPGITMATSALHTNWQEGPLAYLEAENAFESRFVRGNTEIIRFDVPRDAQEESAGRHQQAVERLRIALKDSDPGRVRASLDEISRIMRGIHTSLFSFRCIYNDILSVITNEARESGARGTELYDLFRLSQCLSLDDLDMMLYSVCSGLVDSRPQPKEQDDIPDEVRRAMEMIRKHFSEPDISVSSIAQELGMHDSKLSLVFKRAYKMTPLECLTMYRMRNARKLLCTTQMPVKDIAIECGYYEISGFNRRFKAYTGMTPQQYRMSTEDTVGEA